METSFINWFKKVAVKCSVFSGLFTLLSLFYCWMTVPTFFLDEGNSVVERIYKGTINSSGKYQSTDLEVYFLEMESHVKYYTFFTKEIDKFGITNIVGHKVFYRYSTLNKIGNIKHLKVDNLIVFTSDKANKKFLLSLIIAIVTGFLAAWGFIVDYDNRSKIKQSVAKQSRR